VCQLCCEVDPAVETGRVRGVPLQRVRTLPEDERTESTPRQTQTKTCE